MEKTPFASYDEQLFSEIMLYCLKRCMNSNEINSLIKVKILLMLYDVDKLPSCSDGFLNNTKSESFNPLGIDEDTLDSYSESLTEDQSDRLRQIILVEVRKLHNFCSLMKKKVLTIPLELNWMEHAEKLYSNVLNEIKGLERDGNLQNELQNLKLEGYKIPMLMKNKFMSRATKVLGEERSLLEEIDKTIMLDERGIALDKVERLLEEKILSNKQKIQNLKYQLSEYSV